VRSVFPARTLARRKARRRLSSAESDRLVRVARIASLAEEDAPGTLVAIPADMPTGVAITRVRSPDLPSTWRATPVPEALADTGMRWIEAGRVGSAVGDHPTRAELSPRSTACPLRADPRRSPSIRAMRGSGQFPGASRLTQMAFVLVSR
jgi:hypothetical protein